MSDQQIMEKLKKFTVKDLKQKVAVKNKKYKDANPYKGYSTAKKDELIKMIMDNRNDFKDLVKIKEPITVESIKKKEEKKAVKKSVVKQDTKKEQPVKKPVTKTAKKDDVQGVTSKKSKVEQILNIIKNGTKKQAEDITNYIIEVFYTDITNLFNNNPELQKKYMNKKRKNDKNKLNAPIYKPTNLMNVLENNKSLSNEINISSDTTTNNKGGKFGGVNIMDIIQKLTPEKKEPVKKESKIDFEKDYEKFELEYEKKIENESNDLPKFLKKVKNYFNKNKDKMTKSDKANFKNLIIDIQDEIDEKE
jgi:hypothetical protein